MLAKRHLVVGVVAFFLLSGLIPAIAADSSVSSIECLRSIKTGLKTINSTNNVDMTVWDDPTNDWDYDNTDYKNLDAERVRQILNSNPDAVLVDLRSFDEYNSGHIDEAISVPFSGCTSCFLKEMEKYKENDIIVYCKSGVISEIVSEILIQNGFEKVYNLQGGINLWYDKNFSLTTSSNEAPTQQAVGYLNPWVAMECPGLHPQPLQAAGYLNENKYNYISNVCSFNNHYSDVSSDNSQFRFGCILEKVENTETVPGLQPPSFDWRDYGIMTSVKSQGNCGSCVAFAAVGAFESVIKKNGGSSEDLSEAHLFFCGGGSCSGGWHISSAMNRLENPGVCDENCFRYTAGNGQDQPCDPCSDWMYRVKKILDWNWVSGQSSIKNALINYGPLVTGFTVYEDFVDLWINNGNSVYRHTWGSVLGGHAVVIVGYSDYGNYWICKNSWGTNGGMNGYFKIGYGEVGIDDNPAYMKYSSISITVTKPKIGDLCIFGNCRQVSFLQTLGLAVVIGYFCPEATTTGNVDYVEFHVEAIIDDDTCVDYTGPPFSCCFKDSLATGFLYTLTAKGYYNDIKVCEDSVFPIIYINLEEV